MLLPLSSAFVGRVRNTVLFLTLILAASLAPAEARPATPHRESPPNHGRFLFTSQGKTAIVNADGTGLRYFELKVPGQATWQPGDMFGDGRRIVLLSMEPRRDGPGRPFSQYYSQTPTHLWSYDLDGGGLHELCAKQRLAPFETPALLVSDERILVQVVRNMVGQIYSMQLDGTDAREFTKANEGMPYGLSLSPDGRRVAFHLATAQAIRFGRATWPAKRGPAWRRSPGISTSGRAGRLTASGFSIAIASLENIRTTNGPTCASAGPTGRNIACSPRASRCGLPRRTAIRKRGAADPTCRPGRPTGRFSFRDGCPIRGRRGSSSRSGPTSITSIATTNRNGPAAARKSAGSTRRAAT